VHQKLPILSTTHYPPVILTASFNDFTFTLSMTIFDQVWLKESLKSQPWCPNPEQVRPEPPSLVTPSFNHCSSQDEIGFFLVSGCPLQDDIFLIGYHVLYAKVSVRVRYFWLFIVFLNLKFYCGFMLQTTCKTLRIMLYCCSMF